MQAIWNFYWIENFFIAGLQVIMATERERTALGNWMKPKGMQSYD